MIDENKCYCKLGRSTVIVPYFNEHKQSLTYEDYYGFKVSRLPLEVILTDPILQQVHKRHKIQHGAIIKIEPNRCYNWHQDAERGVSINLLLSHSDSFVLFGNTSQDSEDQIDIIRLDYDVGYFYKFNNQFMHSVINFNEPRYLFSLEFEQDKTFLTYENF